MQIIKNDKIVLSLNYRLKSRQSFQYPDISQEYHISCPIQAVHRLQNRDYKIAFHVYPHDLCLCVSLCKQVLILFLFYKQFACFGIATALINNQSYAIVYKK